MTQQRQTVQQFVATVRRMVPEVKHQVNAWPYPQAERSYLALWLPEWQTDPLRIPDQHVRVALVDTDRPGVLIRVSPKAPNPSMAVAWLREK